MTGSDQLTEHAREEASADRTAARRNRRQRERIAAACRQHGRSTSRSAPASSSAWRVRGARPGRVPDALRGAGPPSTGEVIVRHGGGDDRHSLDQAGGRSRHRVRPARAPAGALRLDVDPRELRACPRWHATARAGLLRPSPDRRRLAEYITELGIVLGRPDDAITTLSGGNQQKVVIARWLAAEPERAAAQRSDARRRRRARSATSTGCSRGWPTKAWRS